MFFCLSFFFASSVGFTIKLTPANDFRCDSPDVREEVYFEYSVNNGTTWDLLAIKWPTSDAGKYYLIRNRQNMTYLIKMSCDKNLYQPCSV